MIGIVIISCTQHLSESEKAGLEYCSCLKQNQAVGKKQALIVCDSIWYKYPLLRRYGLTRANSENETISSRDSMSTFVNAFSKTVDSCNRPFWFTDDTARVY
jgi:hypothetical protein